MIDKKSTIVLTGKERELPDGSLEVQPVQCVEIGKAFNYKLQAKLPTKEEEQEFLDLLLPHQKEYAVKFEIEMPRLVSDFKVVHFTWWETLLRKICKKGRWEE